MFYTILILTSNKSCKINTFLFRFLLCLFRVIAKPDEGYIESNRRGMRRNSCLSNEIGGSLSNYNVGLEELTQQVNDKSDKI